MNGGIPPVGDGSEGGREFHGARPIPDSHGKGRERNRDGQMTKARRVLMDINIRRSGFSSPWESALLALKKVCAGSKSFFKTREV